MHFAIQRFFKDESGQGISEYACILAFVSLLVVMVFGFSSGQLGGAISASFSSMVGQFDSLNSVSQSHST